jgi:hypothetical protein
MRFEMGGIDHELVRRTALSYQFGQDAVEYTQTAPTDKPIIDRLMGPIGFWRIPPAQPIADHK